MTSTVFAAAIACEARPSTISAANAKDLLTAKASRFRYRNQAPHHTFKRRDAQSVTNPAETNWQKQLDGNNLARLTNYSSAAWLKCDIVMSRVRAATMANIFNFIGDAYRFRHSRPMCEGESHASR
jgi:hypothetical protein